MGPYTLVWVIPADTEEEATHATSVNEPKTVEEGVKLIPVRWYMLVSLYFWGFLYIIIMARMVL